MKTNQDLSRTLSALIGVVLFCVSPGGMASSFEECFIKADVLQINPTKGLTEIDAVTVKIISLNSEKSYLCPYQAGQQILIEKVEIGDIIVSDINLRSSLTLHFLSYSAMGANGPVAGMKWRILDLTERHNITVK